MFSESGNITYYRRTSVIFFLQEDMKSNLILPKRPVIRRQIYCDNPKCHYSQFHDLKKPTLLIHATYVSFGLSVANQMQEFNYTQWKPL